MWGPLKPKYSGVGEGLDKGLLGTSRDFENFYGTLSGPSRPATTRVWWGRRGPGQGTV